MVSKAHVRNSGKSKAADEKANDGALKKRINPEIERIGPKNPKEYILKG